MKFNKRIVRQGGVGHMSRPRTPVLFIVAVMLAMVIGALAFGNWFNKEMDKVEEEMLERVGQIINNE